MYFIGKYQKLSEDFITEFGDKINWAFISKYQDLSQKFIFENNLLTYDLSYQNLSDEFRERYNLNTSILFSAFNCGRLNRVIYILKDNPNKIHIGCGKFTKEEAIEAISKKYSGKEQQEYINKVNECFNF